MHLYGDGFVVAFLQATTTYFAISILLHFVVPALFNVTSVQKGDQRPGQVIREALQSLGRMVEDLFY